MTDKANAPAAGTQTFKLKNPLQVESVGGLVQNFVQIFSYIAVLIGVLVLIYIGFKYVLSAAQGNSEEIKKLHGWLLWVVVGIAVIIGARVMVDVVINTITLTGAVDKTVTQTIKKAASGN